MRKTRRGRWNVVVALAVAGCVAVVAPSFAHAADLFVTRSKAIAWLERNQNPDGSWGAGELQQMVTAEALNALAWAKRGNARSAREAVAWLRNQTYRNVDFRARAIRALAKAGEDVRIEAEHLVAEGVVSEGWSSGTVRAASHDTALVLDAIYWARNGPIPPPCFLANFYPTSEPFDTVFAGQRELDDWGWTGDGIDGDGSESSRMITAEVVRSLALYDACGRLTPFGWNEEYDVAFDSLNGTSDPVGPGTDSLELAARLAALHVRNFFVPSTGWPSLQNELLSDARLVAGVWGNDPTDDVLVNALGLLALTSLSLAYPDGPLADADGDGTLNQSDAFPYDDQETADLDGDGIGDNADADRDGDGIPNSDDAFDDDPTRGVDTDGNGIDDDDEIDDDADGLSDELEVALGSDPRDSDSDDDTALDGVDVCPLVAYAADADEDGVCTPADCDDDDPNESEDLDGDSICDGVDPDTDGDGVSDVLEIAAGSDPRHKDSVPPNLAMTPGDADTDGRTNFEEAMVGTNPLSADSDGDGATDAIELAAGTDPNDPSERPAAHPISLSAITTADEALATTNPLVMESSVTGGQATPVANLLPGSPLSAGGGAVNLAGFQALTLLGVDRDGDGLDGLAEAQGGASDLLVDSDGDGFVDGPGGLVDPVAVPNGWNLDGDEFVDGEADHGTSPSDPDNRPGKPGDVAPLGHPNGRLEVGDVGVLMRLVRDPDGMLGGLSGQNRQIVEEAMDADGSASGAAEADIGDVQHVLGEVKNAPSN